MKKLILVGMAALISLIVGVSVPYAQQQDQQNQQQGWNCPWMTQGSNHQMHQGGWYCSCCGSRMDHQVGSQGKPLSKEQAKTLVENYLKSKNNPNLKLGDIADKEDFYEADILTKDGSLADKIQVNKSSGWVRSAY